VQEDAERNSTLPPSAALCSDRYEVVRVLGRGGFGITYEAHDHQHQRAIAIKEFFPVTCLRIDLRVQPAPGGDEHFRSAREKFLSESRVLARLEHPNIVRAYDAFSENNTAYSVMELLHGETLLNRIERSGALPEKAALDIITRVAQALQAVHEIEMLHLDVKPENIFLCAVKSGGESRVVLMDFDLLQPMAPQSTYRTRPLHVTVHCGTPGYAPLEQYTQGTRFGIYTDVYALGATLYHTLTGSAPPDSTDRAARAGDLSLPGVSDVVGEAVLWAMHLQPFMRPQSVTNFLDVLHSRSAAPTRASTRRAPAAKSTNGTDRPGTTMLSLPAAASTGTVTANSAGPSTTPLAATPVAAASSAAQPMTSAPVPPASVAGSDYWYDVTLAGLDVEWPPLCACCCATPETTLNLHANGQDYAIPYCSGCTRHVQANHNGLIGGVWSMAIGFVLAMLGVLLLNLVLGPIGVFLHFGGMAYWGLQQSYASELTAGTCSETKIAVICETHRARGVRWSFKSQRFAQELRRLNADRVV
jgi:serine/threonine-protein kinase